MRRFFIQELPATDEFDLPPALAHRIHHVLRLRPATEFELIGRSGARCVVRLLHASPAGVTVGVLSHPGEDDLTPGAPIIVWQCVPKGGKLEQIVQDCTELGAAAIGPVFSARTIPRWDSSKTPARLRRLTAIAVHAAEQSRRPQPPEVLPPATLAETVRRPSSASRLVLDPGVGAPRLGPLVETLAPPLELLVGPEGGLTEEECELAHDSEWQSVSLGGRLVRAETAAPAALAIICDRWEQ